MRDRFPRSTWKFSRSHDARCEGRSFAVWTRMNTLPSLRTPSQPGMSATFDDREKNRRATVRMGMKTERITARSLMLASAMAVLLAACGGGEKTSSNTVATTQATIPDDAGAVRFLSQASFGATAADMASLKSMGLENWLDQQFRMARSGTHLDYVRSQIPLPIPQGTAVTMDPLYHSFWRQAMLAPDQLRQRVTFALSQITVISAADAGLQDSPHTISSDLDVLADNAFGNYRDILQAVSTHPAMGQYLTALGNRGDNGRTPDENYAREVMQLFTIGLFELN